MRIERYSSLLDQILNQHKVDPIDEVYLDQGEFDSVSHEVWRRGITDTYDKSTVTGLCNKFTIKHCAIGFFLEE